MRVALLTLTVALCACGGNRPASSPTLPPLTDGSRLRAQVLIEPGGLQIFENFWDSRLGFNCIAQQINKGDPLRCVPPVGTATLYADASCTAPLLKDELSTDTFRIGPPTELKFFRRGDAYPADGPVYQQPFAGGPCTPGQVSGPLFRGIEVPPESMVKFSLQREGAGRIQLLREVGEDGSSATVGFFDTALDSECVALLAGDGVLRCLPVGPWAGAGSVFADAGCTVPAAEEYSGGATFAMVSSGFGCDARYELHRLGKVLEKAYQQTGGSCQPIDPTPDVRFLAVGGALDLVKVQPGVRGEGRIEVDTLQAGEAVVQGGFHDRVFDSDCFVATDPGSQLRCAPPLSQLTSYFRDAACSQPVTVGRDVCARVGLLRSDDGQLFRRGAEVQQVFWNGSGTCSAFGGPVHEAGEAFAWTGLVALERHHR